MTTGQPGVNQKLFIRASLMLSRNMTTLKEAIAKARAYGEGQIPIHNLPPHSIKQSVAGFCDYCNTKRPVVYPVCSNQYFVCWKDQCMLEQQYGKDWLIKIQPALKQNRELRMQQSAQRKARRVGQDARF